MFVGVKMLLSGSYPIPITWSLLFIAATLAVSVGASLLFPKQQEARAPGHDPLELPDVPSKDAVIDSKVLEESDPEAVSHRRKEP